MIYIIILTRGQAFAGQFVYVHCMCVYYEYMNVCTYVHMYVSVYVTGFDKSRLGRTHQANTFSTTN